jgi:FixJ family two-component response regulator
MLKGLEKTNKHKLPKSDRRLILREHSEIYRDRVVLHESGWPSPQIGKPETSALTSLSTVFLVDDDASVRKALTRLIKSAGYQVQVFGSAREFLDTSPEPESSACLVLDVRLPGLTGLDLQSELQAVNANLPIIFITGHGDIPMSVRAMKAGAVDFLSKPVKDEDLLSAIDQALARAARQSAERLALADIRSHLERLTPREREVLEHVVSGQLNKQIAFDLGTVEKTVKVHRARIMEKMGVQSLAELVRMAERVGIGGT